MSKKNRPLILIGFMGSGKSSVGQELAKLTLYSFLDTDNLIEEKAGKNIASIFDKEGEPYFRELESTVIKDLKNRIKENHVIATGGGAVLRKENRDNLRATGIVIWLTAQPDEILRRVKGSDRPLLQKKNKEEALKELLDEREEFYRLTAHHTVKTDGKTPEITARDIIKNLLN